MPYKEPDKPASVFQTQDVWHYRIEGYAAGTVVGHGLPTEKTAKRWLAKTHGVGMDRVKVRGARQRRLECEAS